MDRDISIAELTTGRKHKAKEIRNTGYICTAYFGGKDGKGTCCTECQWWNDDDECPCAKGSKSYDGKGNQIQPFWAGGDFFTLDSIVLAEY